MKQEVQFDRDVYRFLEMAVQIWPTFQAGVRHLHEVAYPSSDSFLPQRPYSTMTESQFRKTIVDDLFEFIMNHDVTTNDLYDYLSDILSLLMIEEDLIGGSSNPCSIEYMANFTHSVIQELTDGKTDKIYHFQLNIYQPVKQFKGNVVEDKNNEESSSNSDSNNSQNQMEEEEGENEKKVQPITKTEEELKQQKQLQDDGWTIVKK